MQSYKCVARLASRCFLHREYKKANLDEIFCRWLPFRITDETSGHFRNSRTQVQSSQRQLLWAGVDAIQPNSF